MISTYNVAGMTCGHCARSVAREVAKVPGVDDVRVDLAAGIVTVLSVEELDADAVAAAVDFAGYELLG